MMHRRSISWSVVAALCVRVWCVRVRRIVREGGTMMVVMRKFDIADHIPALKVCMSTD